MRAQLLRFVRQVVKALSEQFRRHGSVLDDSRSTLLQQQRHCEEHIVGELSVQVGRRIIGR